MKCTNTSFFLGLAIAAAACGIDSVDGTGTGGPVGGTPDAAPPSADAAEIVEPVDPRIPEGRVTSELQLLYTFQGRQGQDSIPDVSDVGTPYDLTIQDPLNVQWAEAGMAIVQPTIARNPTPPLKVLQACQASNAITLEAWVRAGELEPEQRSRVFAFSIDPGNRNFDIGQEQTAWDARLRTEETGLNGNNPSTTTNQEIVSGEMQHVAFVRDNVIEEGTLYVNGIVRAQEENVDGLFGNWNSVYGLNVANEATLDRPFIGQLNLAAVYCRALSTDEVRQNYEAGY